MKKGELEQLVLSVMERENRPLENWEIAELCEQPKERVSQALYKLRRQSKLKSVRHGVWALREYEFPLHRLKVMLKELLQIQAAANPSGKELHLISLQLASIHLRRALDNTEKRNHDTS